MKVGIVGMGWVGSSVAISTLHAGIASELVVCDIREELAEGEAMDLAQGVPFYPTARVRSGSVADLADASAVVIAAGRGGRPGETRLDLLRENARIVQEIATELRDLQGILVLVTNPVDVLTRVARDASGLPVERVIGTGTMLDTARLRHALGMELDVDPRSIHANVAGEHGDSEVFLWSSADIGGRPLRRWPGWSHERETRVAESVRRAAYEIIRRKGATNHAIGLVTAALLRWVLRGERRVLSVSRVQQGVLGLQDVALSLPTVVGRSGAADVIEPALDEEEREALERSAAVLREAFEKLRG